MRLKNEDGWSLMEVLFTISIISLMIFSGVWGFLSDTNRINAKKYFGISDVYGLSNYEKDMLGPMVDQQLRILNDNAHNAARKELALLGNRDDIFPATADKAVAGLRAAQAKKKEAARNLATACKTARYFSLISKESEWCK